MIRVLVADDHPIVRGGIVALLESADDLSVVGEASTGLQAVELAFEHEPDIVLMGSHGRHRLEKLLGSVAQRVLSHAHLPVMVVRA